LGTTPQSAASLAPADSEPSAASGVVIISHGLWLAQFNGDRSVPGKEIILNGHPVSVIGVARKLSTDRIYGKTDVLPDRSPRGIARPGIAPIDRVAVAIHHVACRALRD
jgi:hypothetical protein